MRMINALARRIMWWVSFLRRNDLDFVWAKKLAYPPCMVGKNYLIIETPSTSKTVFASARSITFNNVV